MTNSSPGSCCSVAGFGRIELSARTVSCRPPIPDLSVTRQFGLSEVALWQIGQAVADSLQKILYGRADLKTADVRRQRLQVDAAPLSENLNHANITGWPPDKPSQKIIAQELAASATFVAME